ncbi:MAG: aldehyde ferredoxin oxidoreductase N-terminal domain-containing protein, partial [Desulfosarcina sp.]
MTAIETKEITTKAYSRPTIDKGYTNHYLDVDLSADTIAIGSIEEKIKKTFIGGKGFDLWLLWNAVKGENKWNDPQNAICIASGPMGGTPAYPGSGKSIVTSISPTTGSVMDSNVGGYFGPYLKFSGFDALRITGKAPGDTVVFIDGIEGKIEILRIPGLPEDAYALSDVLTDHFSQGKKVGISVVSAGPGAAHTLIGCLNFSWYDNARKQVR